MLLGCFLLVDIELAVRIEVVGIEADLAVVALVHREVNRLANSARQHKTFVVVGVFADEVDAPRGAELKRFAAVKFLVLCDDVFE